jgi:hypothetical protein
MCRVPGCLLFVLSRLILLQFDLRLLSPREIGEAQLQCLDEPAYEWLLAEATTDDRG